MSRFARSLARFTFSVVAAASFQASGDAQCLSCVQNLSLPLSYYSSIYPVDEGGGPSTFVAQFSRITGDYDITDGVFYSAWCADDPDFSSPAHPASALWSTYAINLPAALSIQAWDKVNWVLNNRSDATARDVQQAIWLVLASRVQAGTTATPKALALASQAQSGFVPGNGQVVAVILPGNSSTRVQNMIFEVPVQTGRIGDLVWEDTNGNGIQEPGEPGVNGVVVRLKNTSGDVLASRTTGAAASVGSYLFDNLAPGDYIVDYDASTIPAGLEATLALAGGDVTKDSNTNSSAVHLERRQSDLTVDFGLRPACNASVGDFVWRDLNGNGIQDAAEPGIDGMTVRLLTLGGQEVKTTTTAQNGFYQFTSVCSGTYIVSLGQPPSGDAASPANAAGSTPANDSDGVSGVYGVSAQVTVQPGSGIDSIDFGFVPPCKGSIGNFVWWDQNRNGVQDEGEPAIGGVTLRLLKGGIDTGNSVTSSGEGRYSFTGLCAGSYTVVVDSNPNGYAPTHAYKGAAAVDSNGIRAANGVKADVTLSDNASSDDSIDFGFNGACSGTIGDLVWYDVDRDGVQDAGEPGIKGVFLNLKDPVDNRILASTSTGDDGKYSFGALCTGTYAVEAMPPSGFAASPQGGAGAATDSNSNPSTVVLASDLATDDTIDFGFYPGSIGDFVWNDANRNGLQDDGQSGLGGLTVTLKDAGGAVLRTTTTAADGSYLFTGVPAGSYMVCVAPAEGWVATYDLDGLDTPDCAALTLAAGEARSNLDFGYYQPASIGDRVWLDANNNKAQDTREPGLIRWTVSATGPNYSSSQPTEGNGGYSFGGLLPGTYTVCVTPQQGYSQSYDLDGVATANCATVTVAAGQNRTDVDFGYTTPNGGGGAFATFTQGGWGSKPRGNNPGMLLKNNWTKAFPAGSFSIGGDTFRLTFTSPAAVQAFLPQGGTAGVLDASATNPATSSAGVFAGQVVALTLSVAMSDAGVTRWNLAGLTLTSGKLAGETVAVALRLCNSALNGGVLPFGLTISDLNGIVDAINNNFDNGTVDRGYLR